MKTVWAMVLILAAGGAFAQGKTWRWQSADGMVHYSDMPPPAGARNVQEISPSGNVIEQDAMSFSARKAAAEHPVTIYTSGNCTDPCKDAREYLSSRGIPFTELQLTKDEDLAGYRKIFGNEEAMAPSITVGNTQKARGFERGNWKKMLDLAGYPGVGGRPSSPTAAGK